MQPTRMTPDSSRVFLSLGSNVGDREAAIKGAIGELAQLLAGLRVGGVYETEALHGAGPQRFLNTVVVGMTELPPEDLLRSALAIETRLGRQRNRSRRYAPRRIDIDVLLYGAQILDTPHLSVPHPLMSQRAFVLIPLLDLDPEAIDPRTGDSFRTMLDRLPDQGVYSYRGDHYNGPAV